MTPMMAGLLVTSIAQRAADQPLRPLQAVPDRRHGAHGRRRCACSPAPRRHLDARASPATWSCSGSASAWSCRCSCSPPRTPSTTSTSASPPPGSTLFRQIGGSIGVAVFGAIFANQLAANLASKLPPGAQLPGDAEPERDRSTFRRRVHDAYVGRDHERAAPGLPGRRGGSCVIAFLPGVAPARAAAANDLSGAGPRSGPRGRTRRRRAAGDGARALAAGRARPALGAVPSASPHGPGSTSTHRSCGCWRDSASVRR